MERVVFFNTGWMDNYQGPDEISGGGRWVQEHKAGHEFYNFKDHRGWMYGYVQPTGKVGFFDRIINIQRLGASKNQESIDGVLVLWTAPSRKLGRVIVGWYLEATVFRHWQKAPDGSGRIVNVDDKADEAGFYCRAKADNCELLPEKLRTFKVPYGKGGMGRNVWFADTEIGEEFKKRALEWLSTNVSTFSVPENLRGTVSSRQVDSKMRSKVESAAIDIVWNHYEQKGYKVETVERDNLGWDLNVHIKNLDLKVEVKGLSGNSLSVGLSPNEYEGMNRFKNDYHLAVVTNALTNPVLTVFFYNRQSGYWEDSDGRRPKITPKTGATVHL